MKDRDTNFAVIPYIEKSIKKITIKQLVKIPKSTKNFKIFTIIPMPLLLSTRIIRLIKNFILKKKLK